jgi:hypothetical protein
MQICVRLVNNRKYVHYFHYVIKIITILLIILFFRLLRFLCFSCSLFFNATLRSGQFRGQKGLGPLEKPREMPHYMFCPRKKIISRTFKISGALIVKLLFVKYHIDTVVTNLLIKGKWYLLQKKFGEMLSFVFLQRRLEALKKLSHEIEMGCWWYD